MTLAYSNTEIEACKLLTYVEQSKEVQAASQYWKNPKSSYHL